MPAEGLGPEITSAHVAITASFRGMANSVQREAQAAGRTLGTTLASGASSGARSAGQKAGQEFGSGFSEKTSEAFKNVFVYGGAYAAIRGVSSAVRAITSDVIGFNSKIEQSDVAFKGLLGSSKAAEAELSWIKDFAKTTPFQFGDLLTDDQQLIAMGASAKEAHTEITAIGDAAAGLGRGKDEINKMVLAIGQMTSKGRIQSDELLQLQEAGIPALKMLAKAYGATTTDMQKAITKGLISSDKAVPALIGQIEARFKGQMANQSKTFSGAVSNIEDTLQQGIAQAGKGAFDEVNKAAHEFLDYLNSPAGQKTIEDIGHAFTDAAKTAEFLGHAVWSVRSPLLAVGAGFLVIKAGEAILVKGASVAGGLAKAYKGAGSEASIAAKMNDAYTASLGRMAEESTAAVRSIDRVAAAQVRQAERGAAGGKITAESSAFNSLPSWYGAQTRAAQASTYKQAQAAMDGAESSARRLSFSAAGVGRAFAASAPAIGVGTLAITSLTGTADTATGKVANFMATGAMLGSSFGPWGAAIGAAGGAFVGMAENAHTAQEALDDLAKDTSWDQLFKDADKAASAAKAPFGSAIIADAKDLWSGITGGRLDAYDKVSSQLKDVGSSVEKAEAAAKRGGRAWQDYRNATLDAVNGNQQVKEWLDQVGAGATHTRNSLQALSESNFAAANATYKTADAFIAAAKEAGFSSQEINILSAAARSVPAGASIIFSTNALAVMNEIEQLRASISNQAGALFDNVTNGGYSKSAKQKIKDLQGQLKTDMTYTPSAGSAPLSLPPLGGTKAPKAHKAKKAYNVDIYDPFSDEGWEKLTGGQIAKDLKRMQDQANKAFAAMKKGSMSFSKEMKDLAHGKELKKAFAAMKADSRDAITSMRGDIADLKKDMVQMGKDLASAINPADFGMDVTGATDFFGNPIKGSTEAAYKSQVQQQGKDLAAEQKDMSVLAGWGLSGDYLQQLLQSGNKTLMDELVAGGKTQALQIFNMTKSNNSIATLIGNQVAAQTTAYAADRAEAAALQKQVNVLAAFVTQIQKDEKDGKLSKKELTKIKRYGDEVKNAFKAATK
jgi:tape measure domain-containing protein